MALMKFCLHPGCTTLVEGGRCPEHEKHDRIQYDKARGSNTERGYGYAWSLIRKRYLQRNPLCVDCLQGKPERVTVASEVHHITKKRDGGTDRDENLMALCKKHHSARTMRGE